MAGGGKVRIADRDDMAELARVVNGRLLVSSTGGGGGGSVDVTAVAGVAVAASTPGVLPVSIENDPITVDQGTSPWVVGGTVTAAQATHDNLNCNSNIQVGDADVAFLNPVPILITNLSVPVAGTVTVSSITAGVVPGTGNTQLGKSEDSVHNSGSTGVMALAVRHDNPSLVNVLAGNGDYIPPITDEFGYLRTSGLVRSGNDISKILDIVSTLDTILTGVLGVPAIVKCTDPLGSSQESPGSYGLMHVDEDGALWIRDSNPGDVVETIALSGSTRGRPIQITATASTGTTIHTATTTAGSIDRIYIWLANTGSAAVTVTIEFGTTGVGNEIDVIVPANETVMAVDGAVLGGAATDTVTAYATTGSVVNAFGRVERLT